MSAEIIDGRPYAARLKADLSDEVAELRRTGAVLGLATVLVGDDFAATAYERRLAHLAADLGVEHIRCHLETDCQEQDLLSEIEALNAHPRISGILVLRPLPPQIRESTVFRTIDPTKDIESVHPENAGLLSLGIPRFVPSTAASVFYLLDSWLLDNGEQLADFYHQSLVVVVGRSNNVGKPCVSLAFDRQAGVSSVDEWASRTGRLGRHTRRADVLIVAAGRPGLIRAEHVAKDAIVLDVGINPVHGADGVTRMVGDVDFESVLGWARAVTPVPGGIGPITDVWLLSNTVLAARLSSELHGIGVSASATLTQAES